MPPSREPILRKVDDDTLELDLSNCKGYTFRDALDKIREVPGRRFDYDRKMWMVEATPDNAERILATIRPKADQSIHDWVRESKTKATEELTSAIPDDAEVMVPWGVARQPWQPEVINDEKFNGALPYQRAAIAHLAQQVRALLADDMGLGKTFMAISAVEEYKLRKALQGDGIERDGPKLVVAPNSVKGSWARELNRWLQDPAVVIADGSTPKKRHDQIQEGILNDAWIIVNWEQLRIKREKIKVQHRDGGTGTRTVTLMKEALFEYPGAADWGLSYDEWDFRAHAKAKRLGLTEGWLAILGDEIHRAKNKDALQTKGLHRTSAEFMLGLTGTPLMNSPDELWSILHWLYPMEYTSYWEFFEKYVDYYENDWEGKVITGVKNPDGLRFELKGRLVRRTAKILKLKGRKRIYYDVPLTPGQQKLYNDAETEMWLSVQKAIEQGDETAKQFAAEAVAGASVDTLIRIPNGAARLVRLMQIIENAALVGGEDDSALMDDFEQKLTDAGPHQTWVVGCKFKESCNLLKKRLEKHGIEVGLYTGDVDPEKRTELEDRFQRGEVQVIVGTVAALKEGITLTNGRLMYQLTRDHVPAVNEQFEARRDRLGQQEQVIVYIPQAKNTVATSNIQPTNKTKERIVGSVIPKDAIKEVHT